MSIRTALLVLVALLCSSSLAFSQENDANTAQLPRPQLEQVALVDVLDAVRRNDERSFLIDHRVRPSIVIGRTDLRRIDYEKLLLILRNNDLAAVTAGDIVNIIPVSIVRQYPLPVIYESDDSILDEEWVTWVIQTENATPQSIVPIVRPIMPAAGHFAADPEAQSMLLVDRYGNAKRIVALIEHLDDATPPGN